MIPLLYSPLYFSAVLSCTSLPASVQFEGLKGQCKLPPRALNTFISDGQISNRTFNSYKPPRRFAPAGLILIYHYSYSTITAPFLSPFMATVSPYSTLASLHFLFSLSLSRFLFPPSPLTPSSSLPTLPVCACNMPIQLHYVQLKAYRLCYPRRRL